MAELQLKVTVSQMAYLGSKSSFTLLPFISRTTDQRFVVMERLRDNFRSSTTEIQTHSPQLYLTSVILLRHSAKAGGKEAF